MPQTHADEHRLLSRATCSAQNSHRFARDNRHVMGINDTIDVMSGAIFGITPHVGAFSFERYLKAEIRRMVLDLPEGQVRVTSGHVGRMLSASVCGSLTRRKGLTIPSSAGLWEYSRPKTPLMRSYLHRRFALFTIQGLTILIYSAARPH